MKGLLAVCVLLAVAACNPVLSGQPKPFLPHYPGFNPEGDEATGLRDQLQAILVSGGVFQKNEVGVMLVSDGSLVLEEEASFPVESIRPLLKLYVDVVREDEIGVEREHEAIDREVFRSLGVQRPDVQRVRMTDLLPWANRLAQGDLRPDQWNRFLDTKAKGGWTAHKTASGNLFLYAGKAEGILSKALLSPDKKIAAFIFAPEAQESLSRELLRKIVDFTISEIIYFPI